MSAVVRNRDSLWAGHDAEYRNPRQVVSQWREAGSVDSSLLRARVSGKWWEILSRLGITLLVTREYEHLVMAMRAGSRGPRTTCMRLPHPSGIVADRKTGSVWIASTRLPNQVYEFRPVSGLLSRSDMGREPVAGRPLLPVSSRVLPGCAYLHDLALIGGKLYGTAVGMNSVVCLGGTDPVRPVWWPRAVERRGRPDFTRNHVQLNSIAAGTTLRKSFFSASADEVTVLKPGDPEYPVDSRGVVFSGATREAVVRGLTRPHSARLFRGRVWVDNSGYGEVGFANGGMFHPVLRLPGWTRGLCFCRDVMFVGTSRVLPRFRKYAPGLDAGRSVCGVHAVDAGNGRLLGSLIWPAGNQVFGLDWLPSGMAGGLPFPAGAGGRGREKSLRALFYAFKTT